MAIKNGESRETGNIVYTGRRQTKQKHNAICDGHHYAQIHITKIQHENSYEQLEVKTNQKSGPFFVHHNISQIN